MGAVDKKTVEKVVTLGNPLGLTSLFTIFTMVAKVLKILGILDELEKKAEATETEADDKMIRIAKGVLDELAK